MTELHLSRINVKGYASPRKFSGFQIPIPLQSMAIRRYCEELGYVFNHHVVENVTEGSYFVLERIVAEASKYDAVAMCSLGLLPRDKNHRTDLLARFLAVGTSLHFVFERFVLLNESGLASLNELADLIHLARLQEQNIQNLQERLGLS